jgi:hypothetical protein
MRNPLRSEAEAYRFLGVVIVGAAVIIGAAFINTWLGVAVAVVAFGVLAWWLMKEPVPGAADPPAVVASGTAPGTHRVLVVAPPGTGTSAVKVPDGAEALVVVPATAGAVEALTGAVDDRRGDAEETAAALESHLPGARVEVGADDPALAVEDALRVFGADEVLVVGDEELVQTIRERVAIPVSRA